MRQAEVGRPVRWLVVDRTFTVEGADLRDVELELPGAGYLTGRLLLTEGTPLGDTELKVRPGSGPPNANDWWLNQPAPPGAMRMGD